MAETRNIVILGASFGGLGTAHYICKHILPKLANAADAKYILHIVDPSTHFWWHIAAPREIVSVAQAAHEKYFLPIRDGFTQYATLQDSIVFHQATATALDTQARTVTLSLPGGDAATETLAYHALVIATGIRSPTPLTTLQGDHIISQRALEAINTQISTAKAIVIGGGGPVGVEIAGEIATHLKGKPDVQITLVTGASRLLPVLSEARAKKAHKLLEKAGVAIKYGVKTTGSVENAGRTEVGLSDGTTLVCDVYIPASGVTPNTEFLPRALVNAETGYVAADASTLRVPLAGERVYVAGDVAGIDKGGVLNMLNSLPVLHANLAHDLLAGAAAEKKYTYKPSETQLVPVGPKTGVAAFNGFGMPGFAVAMIKGKDYMAGEIPKWTQGKAFVKA